MHAMTFDWGKEELSLLVIVDGTIDAVPFGVPACNSGGNTTM
jgi:hypothetical protein